MINIQSSIEIGPGVVNFHWHGDRCAKVYFAFATQEDAMAALDRMETSLQMARVTIQMLNRDSNPRIESKNSDTDRPPSIAAATNSPSLALSVIFPPGDERLGLNLAQRDGETFMEAYSRRSMENLTAWSKLTTDEQRTVLKQQSDYMSSKGPQSQSTT